jgi:hypothetical protein
VIEDIEGATPEPTRRRHAVVLSGAVAIASLVLLLTLVVPAPVVPARVDTAPAAASPASSESAGTVMMFAPNAISRMRVDLSRTTVCSDGTRLQPPYFLIQSSTGPVFAGQFDERTGAQIRPPIPVAFRFDARTGWMTITCATDDLTVPRESDAR